MEILEHFLQMPDGGNYLWTSDLDRWRALEVERMVLKERESLSHEMRCLNGIAFERREDQFGPNSNASMTAWYAHTDKHADGYFLHQRVLFPTKYT